MSSRIKGIRISVSSKIRDGQNDVHVSPINIVPETEFGASCIDESRGILVQTRTKAEDEQNSLLRSASVPRDEKLPNVCVDFEMG